jgi:DNA-binding SARP family transcriptional activator/tetratricopeptide (TPR) repeat protein
VLTVRSYGILGPLEARVGGRRVAIGGPQQRALLAVLLVNANRVVSVDRLIDQLWDGRPPATARRLLHGCVADLRRALRSTGDDQVLLTRPPGYLLVVRPGELDADRFTELAAAAETRLAEGSLPRAAELLREALALWRGPVLEDVSVERPVIDAVPLAERRLGVLESRIDVDLRLGRHAELVAELRALVAENPLRERTWAQLMLALHGSHRTADALATFRELRQTLVDQLGIEPSEPLRRLEQAILSGEDVDRSYREEPRPVAEQVPAQLPGPVSSFTGRATQLRQLDDRLAADGAAITAITGTAGVGKTALAVHWAHRVRDRFPDGQLFVNLRGYAQAAPVAPIQALAGFLHALGLPADQVPAEVEAAAALYRTLLADKRMLVLLDNAGGAEQVRPLLPGGAGCHVLVTSRDGLGGLVAADGARVVALDVLEPAEAEELLARMVGAERVAAEPEVSAALIGLCARLPLALRITAANLAARPGRPIAGHVAALTSGNRLTALAVPGDPQTAVRAAFDLSYAALDPPARTLFRLLGLVPGPDVTAAAAAALTGGTPATAARLLDRLAAASLLSPHPPDRYACHDLLRLYAAELAADEDGSAEAVHRLYSWYLHSSRAAGDLLYPEKARLPAPSRPEPVRVAEFADVDVTRAWLDAERANLAAATTTAAAGPEPEFAWLLADALRGYYWLGVDFVEWEVIASAGLAAADRAGATAGRAATELSLADLCRTRGRSAEAIDHYRQAVAHAAAAGWSDGEGSALGNLGSAYFWRGELSDAAAYYQRAYEFAVRTGRVGGQGVRLGNLGLVSFLLGDLTDAADYHARALEIHRRIGSRHNEALDLENLGEAYHALGRLADAFGCLNRALELHGEVGYPAPEARRLLAAVQLDAGRTEDALGLATEALDRAVDMGDRPLEANAINTLGSVQVRLGRHRDAIAQHARALVLSQEFQVRYAEVSALVGLAEAHQRAGERDDAGQYARRAVELARRVGFRVVEAQALTLLAAVSRDLGDPAALELAEQALQLHRATGHRLGEERTIQFLAELTV